MLAMVLGPLLGALFLGTASLFGTALLIGGVWYGLTKYIEYINSVIDRPEATVEQKQILIAAVSLMSTMASAFAYFKAAGDFSAVAMGMLMGLLNTGFKKLEELLFAFMP